MTASLERKETLLNVELLYFDGCPTHEEARRLVQEVLQEEGVTANIVKIHVQTEEDAVAHRFLGSPTVRIEGKDVERAARGAKDFGRKCRVYLENGKAGGLPSKEMIRNTLQEVLYEKGNAGCR